MSGRSEGAASDVSPAIARLLRAGHWTRLEHPALSPFQQVGAAWIVRTCRRHGGALLYDAPGLGKTRTALVAAQALGGSIEVIAPAVVLGRWREELEAFGMSATLISDGVLSRSGAPPCTADVIIVDEAHRFATVGTRRSEALARRVVGRAVVLLTATPARNRPAEVGALVELFAPLSMLVGCGDGRPPGAAQLEAALGHVGLGRSRDDALAFDARAGVVGAGLRLPQLASRTLPGLAWSDEELDTIGQIAGALVPLRGEPRVLYRLLVWRALSSSPQAAAATLRRGCAFARRWLEAAAVGRTLARSEYRALLGEEGEQLVFGFWYREGDPGTGFDAGAVLRAERLAGDLSRKPCVGGETLDALAALEGAAVLFAERRETVDAYARALRERRLVVRVHGGAGWLPGLGRCGVGDAVAWFVAAARAGRAPMLVCTPILSEGLDLQCAHTVVHLDVAWNPARMEQREGRIVRPGGTATAHRLQVSVCPAVEARCGLERLLAAKGGLPAGQTRGSPVCALLTAGARLDVRRNVGRLAFYVAQGRAPAWVFAFAGGGLVIAGDVGAYELARPLRGCRRRKRPPWWLRLRLARRRVVDAVADDAALRRALAMGERLCASGAPLRAASLVREVSGALRCALPRGLAQLRTAHGGAAPDQETAHEADWRRWLAEVPRDRARSRSRLAVVVRIRGGA